MRTVRRNPDFDIDTEQLMPFLLVGGAAAAVLLAVQNKDKLFGAGGGTTPTAPGAGAPMPSPTTPPQAPGSAGGNPPTGSTDPTLVVGSAPRRAAITKLYPELLFRQGTTVEIDAWDRTGFSIADVRTRFEASTEYQAVQSVRTAYASVLGRDPESDGVLRYWVQKVIAQGLTQQQLNAAITAANSGAGGSGGGAQQPPAVTPAPSGQAVDVLGLWLNVPSPAGRYTSGPLQQIPGYVRVRNNTATTVPYQVQLIWKNSVDGSNFISGADSLAPNETRDLTFTATMPGTTGTFQAYFGLNAGGQQIVDPNTPEPGNWSIDVRV